MKKVSIYILIVILLSFIFPIILTVKFNTIETIGEQTMIDFESQPKDSDNIKEGTEISNYEYSHYGEINVFNTATNENNIMNIDEYLYGVVSAEMPAKYDMEALKAQAVVARTYTIYTITHNEGKHPNGAICTSSTCCQAWISKEDRMNRWEDDEREENWNKIEECVNSTKGQVITYEGQVIDAFFHSNSGGKTEIPANVWGGTNYPYLQVVETSGEDGYDQYSSDVAISKTEVENLLKRQYSNFTINWNDSECLKIAEYTDGGRVRSLKIGNKELSGVQARTLFGLKSANFTVNIDKDNIKFSVIGYGHGVGMSQTGADAMAKKGCSYIDIINHFYVGVEIINI